VSDVPKTAGTDQNPELLPEDWEDSIRAELEAAGEDFPGAAEWMVYEMEFEEDDRLGLFMDHDDTTVIRGQQAVKALDEAEAAAQGWAEGSGHEVSRVPFGHLPNLFQYALMTAVRREYIDPVPAYYLWVPADLDDGKPAVPVRRFPPPVEGSEEAAIEEGKWTLLRTEGVIDALAERGW